jgi:hypothetical protein
VNASPSVCLNASLEGNRLPYGLVKRNWTGNPPVYNLSTAAIVRRERNKREMKEVRLNEKSTASGKE